MAPSELEPILLKGAKKKLSQYTKEEVAQHRKEGDLWCIIDHYVFDLSSFADLHPGGLSVLLDPDIAGQDSTEAFFGLHTSDVLYKYAPRLIIGTIKNSKPVVHLPLTGQLSKIPNAEPNWLTKGYHSPYYNSTHRQLQREVRRFFEEELKPEAIEFGPLGKKPSDKILKLISSEGIEVTAMRLGPGKHLIGRKLLGGIEPKDFNYFHELVLAQEWARIGAFDRGYQDGLLAGMAIGLPPVMNFGSKEMVEQVVPPALRGEKTFALAISEAFAGSDVSRVRTTAVKTPDGKHYIVNGTKKWITNGTFADYFTVGVRTGKDSLSMLLIPRQEGVDTKAIKTSYSASAATAYVTFDNVQVPIEHLIGKEGQGFQIILSNFNHERWSMVCATTRWMRTVTEQCFVWAHVRKVFGKALISQPVIRNKLASMFSKCDATQAWLEHVTYQMTNMTYAEQSTHLAGPIALLKAYSTRCANEVADHAVQIFGGRGISKTGMGKLVEEFSRTNKFDAVLGGSEEILMDLGVKQAMKKMPNAAL